MNATMKYKKEKEVHDLSQHAKTVICNTEGRLVVELFGGMTADQINEYIANEWPEDEE